MTSSEIDPFALLAMRDDSAWPEDFDYLEKARAKFDPQNPAPLIALLEADDDLIQRRGLFLFGEFGKKGFVVLDQALKCVSHPSEWARDSLVDGILSYPDELTPDQLVKILPLVTDLGTHVRDKMIVVLGDIRLDLLEAAIALLDEPARQAHGEGLKYLLQRNENIGNIQSLFDAAITNIDVRSAYALASIERMARDGTIPAPPNYAGNDYVADGVVTFVKMLIARREHKRSGGRYPSNCG